MSKAPAPFRREAAGNEPLMGLGAVQRSFLEAIERHGGWHEGCGWVWDKTARTRNLCLSLEDRGLLKSEPGPNRRPRWHLTKTGQEVATILRQRKAEKSPQP